MEILELALKFGLEFFVIFGGYILFLHKRLGRIEDKLDKVNNRITEIEKENADLQRELEVEMTKRPEWGEVRRMISGEGA
jgi:hypothetical protein